MTQLTDLPYEVLEKIKPDFFCLLNDKQKIDWIKKEYGTICCDEEDALRVIDIKSEEGNVYVVVAIAEELRKLNNPNSCSFYKLLGKSFNYNLICLAVKYGTRGMCRVVKREDDD